MARMIPTFSSCSRRMTPGERRVARRLAALLPDDVVFWYDTHVGRRPRYPDFVVLHPGLGLLLLEVKDWRLETIAAINGSQVQLRTDTGLRTTLNPLQQVRQYALLVKQRLEQDPALRHDTGPHAGRLRIPCAYGVVLANITRRQLEKAELGRVLPAHLVLCRDEIAEGVSAEAFRNDIQRLFSDLFPLPRPLSGEDIDRIRWHLFPELRIPAQQSLLDDEAVTAGQEAIPAPGQIIRIMDQEQERLARSLGGGHRVIHGVAGSGKTMLLLYRARFLAEAMPRRPVLFLCFNVVMARHLRRMLNSYGVPDNVEVFHFHGWCKHLLQVHDVPLLPGSGEPYERLVKTVMHAVQSGRIPSGQYGAILIDEGHDFMPEWLRLIAKMVDPRDELLTLAYDDMQTIYAGRSSLSFTLKEAGIKAQGRTTILRRNYRNSREIARLANAFLAHFAAGEHAAIAWEEAGFYGPPPQMRTVGCFREEIAAIADWLRGLHEDRRLRWRDMAVLFRDQKSLRRALGMLRAAGIPCAGIASSEEKRRFDIRANEVKLLTFHSSKGLELPAVAIAGVGDLPGRTDDERKIMREARLLYVAMTRAMRHLLFTSAAPSPFAAWLKEHTAPFEASPVSEGQQTDAWQIPPRQPDERERDHIRQLQDIMDTVIGAS